MESQKPIYGSKEALAEGMDAPKSDAFGVAENSNHNRLENRLGGPKATESHKAEQISPEEIASKLGGTVVSVEVEDPRL